MAAAGPAGNFLIAVAAFVLMRVGLGVGAFVSPDSVNFETIVAGADGEASFVTMLLSVLLVQNVLLGLFNLLPLPPLDGAAVAGALVPEPLGSTMRQFGTNPMASTVGLVVAWQVFPAMARPIFSMLLLTGAPGRVVRSGLTGHSHLDAPASRATPSARARRRREPRRSPVLRRWPARSMPASRASTG